MTIKSIQDFNSLSAEVYDVSGALINDPENSIKSVVIDGYRKHFPAGIYADGQMHANRRLNRDWLVRDAYKIIFRHGHDIAYEGWIGDMGFMAARSAEVVSVPLRGATEQFPMRHVFRRRFADSSVQDGVWIWDTAAAAAGKDKATVGRDNRLKIVPKNVQWLTGEWAQLIYTQPINHSTRRIKGTYNLQEGAQQWKIEIMRSTDGSTWTSEYVIANATGSATFDRTMSVATRWIAFRFSNDAGANQTPASDGSILGEIYNIMVYATIGSLTADITMRTVALHGIQTALTTDFNPDTQYIGTPGTPLVVEPYVWDDWRRWSDVLDKIVGMGDGDLNRWAWEFLDSEQAATPNGLPVLRLRQYPDETSGFDYTIDYAASNLYSAPDMVWSRSTIFNWIPVRYRDANGFEQWLTPNDDAGLKDDASIARYGYSSPDGGLDVGEASQATALSFGKRFLASYKERRWRMSRPLVVSGWISDAYGNPVPACMIDLGTRLRVTGGPADDYGDPPVFIVTGTDYTHSNQTCALVTGSPLLPLIPRIARQIYLASEFDPMDAYDPGGGGGGGGGIEQVEHRHWWERLGISREQGRAMVAAGKHIAIKRMLGSSAWKKMTGREKDKYRKKFGGKGKG